MRALLATRARRVVALAVMLAAAAPAHALADTLPRLDTLLVTATSNGTVASDDPVPTANGAAIARWVGVYRLTLTEKRGGMLDARVLMERFGDRLAGVMLIDQQASGLSDVRVQGDALAVSVGTADGRGRLLLRPDGDAFAGTLTVGKRVWNVTAVRTI